jgi:hypothetical protein
MGVSEIAPPWVFWIFRFKQASAIATMVRAGRQLLLNLGDGNQAFEFRDRCGSAFLCEHGVSQLLNVGETAKNHGLTDVDFIAIICILLQ